MNPEKRQYDLSRQETSYYCMPAVIQAILRRHGREERQADIAGELTRPPRDIVFGENLIDFFKTRALSFCYTNYNEDSYDDPEILVGTALEEGSDVMIGYDLGRGLHLQLVLDLNGRSVVLLDPDDCKEKIDSLSRIYSKMWTDKLGGFGLVGKLDVTKPAQ